MNDATKFERDWRKANELPRNREFADTDDMRAGRVDEIDMCFLANVMDNQVARIAELERALLLTKAALKDLLVDTELMRTDLPDWESMEIARAALNKE